MNAAVCEFCFQDKSREGRHVITVKTAPGKTEEVLVVSSCCNPDHLQCPCGAKRMRAKGPMYTVQQLHQHKCRVCIFVKTGPAVDNPVEPAPETAGGPAVQAVQAYINCCGVHHADFVSGSYRIPGHDGDLRIVSPSEILEQTPPWQLADLVQQSKILAQAAGVFPATTPERGAQMKLTQMFPGSNAAQKVIKEAGSNAAQKVFKEAGSNAAHKVIQEAGSSAVQKVIKEEAHIDLTLDAGAGNGKEEVYINLTHDDDIDMVDVQASPRAQGPICGSASTKRKDKSKSDKQGMAHRPSKKGKPTKVSKMPDFFFKF